MVRRPDWYVVSSSAELGHTPLARMLLGERLVLYRARDGRVVAARDVCPHRNASLSRGCVERGELQCPYHGWRFGEQGALTAIPSATADSQLPPVSLTTFDAAEADGSVFVSLGGRPPQPPRWPGPEGSGYQHFELVTTVACPAVWVINNFVDAAHTGFLHRGLFRGAPRREISAQIHQTPTGIRIETSGEGDSKSLLSRLLLRRGERIEHTDELILPSTVRVDYRFGERHLVSVSMCTPENDERTTFYTRVYLRFGAATRALLPVVERITRRIIEQDRAILEDQAAQLRQYGGPRFRSTDADEPCVWVTHAYQAHERGESPPATLSSATVRYKL